MPLQTQHGDDKEMHIHNIYYAIYALRPLQERYRGGMPEKFIRRRVNGLYHQCETVVRCVAGKRLIEANHLQ